MSGPRGPRTLDRDRRAVSTTVNYVISLGVALLLVTGMLIAAGDFLDGQRTQTTENELEVVGQQIAGDISSAGRLANASENSEFTLERSYPETAAGNDYSLTITTAAGVTDGHELTLESSGPNVEVVVPFTTMKPVDSPPVNLRGGDVEISYDPATGRLVVASA
jgi:hypothetical protein